MSGEILLTSTLKKLQARLDSWQKRNTVFTVYTLTTFQVQTKTSQNNNVGGSFPIQSHFNIDSDVILFSAFL